MQVYLTSSEQDAGPCHQLGLLLKPVEDRLGVSISNKPANHDLSTTPAVPSWSAIGSSDAFIILTSQSWLEDKTDQHHEISRIFLEHHERWKPILFVKYRDATMEGWLRHLTHVPDGPITQLGDAGFTEAAVAISDWLEELQMAGLGDGTAIDRSPDVTEALSHLSDVAAKISLDDPTLRNIVDKPVSVARQISACARDADLPERLEFISDICRNAVSSLKPFVAEEETAAEAGHASHLLQAIRGGVRLET
ncbi:MAG: hypothetical protein AAFV62_14820, partial [Pseudomonadota bacterium]